MFSVFCDVLDLGLVAPDINDGNDENINNNFGEFSSLIEQGHYDVIGVSVDQENMNYNLNILWELRQKIERLDKRCLLIAGGQAATHNYEQWIVEGSLDGVLLGFSEKTLLEFCLAFAQSPKAEVSDFGSKITGIAYKDSSGFFTIRTIYIFIWLL